MGVRRYFVGEALWLRYPSAHRYNEWVIESRIHEKASGNVFNEKWQSKYTVRVHTYRYTHTGRTRVGRQWILVYLPHHNL